MHTRMSIRMLRLPVPRKQTPLLGPEPRRQEAFHTYIEIPDFDVPLPIPPSTNYLPSNFTFLIDEYHTVPI